MPSKSKKSKKSGGDPMAAIFRKNPRSFRIGGSIMPKRDLGRFVRWPKYIRIQRQRKVLKERLSALGAKEAAAAGAGVSGTRGPVVHYGLNHVTTMVEQQRAKLVLIASDVDPIELVLWLP